MMLEQSKALNALVAQLAANKNDPLRDLGSSISGVSSKGALGRAKLQSDLAAHRGTFFTNVLQAMARRMQPSQSPEVEMTTLRDRGVTAAQYLERFGGFGRTRDLGFIIWEVGLILSHMCRRSLCCLLSDFFRLEPRARRMTTMSFHCL
jgi:hypothetical protein